MQKLLYIVAEATCMQKLILPRVECLKEEYKLVCICSPGKGHDEAQACGMCTVALPIGRHVSLWQNIKNVWHMWRILLREKPDIVHSVGPGVGVLGMAAAFFAGISIRIHTFTALRFPWQRGLRRHLLWLEDVFTCLFANIINPEGDGVKRQLQSAHVTHKPLHVIAHGNINGVDLKRFTPQKDRENERQKLGIRNDEVVFIFVGDLVSDKGVVELIDAFCWLHQEYATTRLILVGSDNAHAPLPDKTRQQISTHPAIICAGERQDVECWLAASDVYVLPSHREGFSNSLLEAAATGLPSITYDICGCNDPVDIETGILVPPYDYSALYDGMLQLVNAPDTRSALGASARRRAEKFFDRRNVLQELKHFYKELAHESPSSKS